MRVLECIDTLGGGGAERQLTYLAEGLVRRGREVDVVYMLDGPNGPRLRASGATVHDLGGWRSPLVLLAELRAIVQRRRIDVVHTWLRRMNVVGGAAARLERRAWVYSERSVRALESGLGARVRRWLARRAHAVVANSRAGADEWRRMTCALVQVVPNGVDLDALDAAPAAPRAELGVPDAGELIVYAGRLVAPKNIALLGDALATVLRARPRALAICCGDGEEWPLLRRAVERAGVGARCLTPGYRAELAPLIKAADALIAPSLHEGRPNVVLEAMACRAPLALSDIAQHRECVPRDAALWFSPHSPDGAARALVELLDDRDAARARAERARDAVAGQSIDAMCAAYAALYEHLATPMARGRVRA
jgi:glycosyltransferase involved in cell wall biosynthesis